MLKKHPLPPFAPSAVQPCMCRSGKNFSECCGSRSPDRDPPVGALLYPGFVDTETCVKWVKKLEAKPGSVASVNTINRSGTVIREENALRICSNVNPGVLRKVIDNRIAKAFQLSAAKTGRKVAWFERPSILRYTPGGYYKRHADSCMKAEGSNVWMKIHDRDISLLLYLNEAYTGGGLSFTNFNYYLRPRTGDMLAFPSDNRYEHQAEIVQSGIRYVVVSWAAFVGSPRVLDSPPKDAIHLN